MSEWVAWRVSERASEQRTEQQQAKNGNSNGNKCWFHIRFEKRRQNGKSLFDRLLCSKRKTTKGILRRTLVRIQYTVTHKQHSIACTILYCGLWTRYEAVSLWAERLSIRVRVRRRRRRSRCIGWFVICRGEQSRAQIQWQWVPSCFWLYFNDIRMDMIYTVECATPLRCENWTLRRT